MIGYVLSFVLLVIGLIFDDKIALFFYNYQNPVIAQLLSMITILGTALSIFFIAIFAMALLEPKNKEKRIKNILLFVISFAINLAIVYVLKITVLRERPIASFESMLFEDAYNPNHSFPSGHSASAFLAYPFFEKLRYFGMFWLAFSIIVAFSRVYLGYHHLSDVVAGGLIGYVGSKIIKKKLDSYINLKKIVK